MVPSVLFQLRSAPLTCSSACSYVELQVSSAGSISCSVLKLLSHHLRVHQNQFNFGEAWLHVLV